jgi:hypothetical protein
MDFDKGDKIYNLTSKDIYTIIGISDSYYIVMSTYLTTHHLKFKTAEHYKKIDHNNQLEDLMVWVRNIG